MSTTRDPTRTGRNIGKAPDPAPKLFAAPRKSLEALDAEGAASLIEAASDIALVLDKRGVIQDLSVSLDDLAPEAYADWLGRPWADVVTVESRTKVKSLLDDVDSGAARRWRHINHPALRGGADLPVLYSTVRLGSKGRVVAFGRDMRALASLQQRLVDAQHTLERDYWRLRHVETRYRLLFDMAGEAILVVDASTSRVVEANPAAIELLGLPPRKVNGQPFPLGLSDKGQRDVAAMLARVRSGGRSEDVRVRGADTMPEVQVGASLFTQEDSQLFLVRMRPVRAGAALPLQGNRGAIVQVVERAPDGFVVTDPEGRVLLANPAFVELTQLASEEQVRGESLERWLGRPGVDLSVMLATLRQQGSVRLFATSLRGEHGAQAEVEISAVAVPDGEPPCLGFTVRHVGRRLGAELQAGKAAPRSVEQLTQLVGRMPLKDLVRESTDLIEQLCIEAALKLTQDNRASAAEMLGLSRQSLYVKLRRYGLGDLGADSER